MLRRDLFDKYNPERRIQSRLFCFGSGDSDSGGGGGDNPAVELSDEDLDQDAQQDIAAAAVAGRPGASIGNFRFESDFNPRDPDTAVGIRATENILAAADTAATPAEMQRAVQTQERVLADSPTVQQAIFNLAGGVDVNRRAPVDVGDVPPAIVDLGQSAGNLVPDFITGTGGETFDTTTGDLVQTGFVEGMDGPDPTTPLVFEDEYDPFAGTGQTAMETIGYDLDDQSGPDGRIRPLAGLTRAQQADLEARNDLVSRGILAAQTQQPSGIPTTNLTGIYTFENDPNAMVRGFSDFGPTIPGLGPTQVYTGFGDNPFETSNVYLTGTGNEGGTDLQPPVSNPLTGTSRCPDGFIFDDDLQACRRKTRSELAETGSGGSPAPPVGVPAAPGDIFYRRAILDDAPANLPSGFDFDAANRRFIQSYGVRPDNYRMPLSLTGFTRL